MTELETKRDALADLAFLLQTRYPQYTVNDLEPTDVKGYLRFTKSCTCTMPPYNGGVLGYPSGRAEPHYHALSLVGYRKGYGRGMYAFWRAVDRSLRAKQGEAKS
jgi:hypothetical protein